MYFVGIPQVILKLHRIFFSFPWHLCIFHCISEARRFLAAHLDTYAHMLTSSRRFSRELCFFVITWYHQIRYR